MYALTTHQLQVERGERVIETIKCMRSPHTSYRWRGERVIETIKCMLSPHTSYRWRGERVIETIECMRSPHTSYRWRGERVIETIKCMLSPHTNYRWRGERVIETIKCMRSPHTSYRWRRERHRANQIISLKQICYVTAIISVLSVKTKSIEAQEAKLNRTLHSTSCTHDMTVPPPFWKLWGFFYLKNYGNQNLVKIKLYNSIN